MLHPHIGTKSDQDASEYYRYLRADIAMELFRDWLGECEVVSTILSLARDVC